VIVGFLSTFIFIAAIFLLLRRAVVGRTSRRETGQEIRSFFQYGLLLAITIVVLVGASGLLGRIIDPPDILIRDQAELARNTAFLVVGLPLFYGIMRWSNRSLATDPGESTSFAFISYLTLINIISLAFTLNQSYELLVSLFTPEVFNGNNLSGALIWGGSLAFHLRKSKKLLAAKNLQTQFLLSSAITLVISLVGIAQIIRGVIRPLFPEISKNPLLLGPNPITRGLILFLIAAPLWYFYWIANELKSPQTPARSFYLLLGGVAGSLAATVISASILFYTTLVWFFGDPSTNLSGLHFEGAPVSVGAALVGLLSFAYHRAIIKHEQEQERSEIERIYEYLLSGIGLITAGVSILLFVVSALEALTQTSVIFGGGSINRLLSAITLIIVGGPLWSIMWHRIGISYESETSHEANSITRRIYLLLLFGIGGVAAVVSLLTITFQLFEGLFSSSLSGATLREMAYAIGILLTTGIIAGYHFYVFRGDRTYQRSKVKGPGYLLLIGPATPGFERLVEKSTGAKVDLIERSDDAGGEWSLQRIKELIEERPGENLAIFLDSSGCFAIPIKH